MKAEIKQLMEETGVAFGTSGARGLALQMTDRLCYAYTKGFLEYLEIIGDLTGLGAQVAIAGDLRPSTQRIMAAVAKGAADMGYHPINFGCIPSPAVGLYGLTHGVPAIMVTGSHIPADRNGIKFNKSAGEILKSDESGITSQIVDIPDSLFNEDGSFAEASHLGPLNETAGRAYAARYLDAFPHDCLAGKKIGVYQHSAVGRDIIPEIFTGLGAEVIPLGFSETFVPVDTEAIRPEDVILAREWSAEHRLDAIISTDGDSDRPLISDEQGEWLRGDVACILAAQYLGASSVSTPVSCNTAVDACGSFDEVRRTRIGSPFVVVSMMEATAAGQKTVIGYEANGGFLTNTPVNVFGNELRALPTRDAVLPVLSILLLSIKEGKTISELTKALPARYTLSDRIQEFPTRESTEIIEQLSDEGEIERVFGSRFGKLVNVDRIDGVRMTFDNAQVLHLRPSGNAPEFRCYAEAASPESVEQMLKEGMEILVELKG